MSATYWYCFSISISCKWSQKLKTHLTYPIERRKKRQLHEFDWRCSRVSLRFVSAFDCPQLRDARDQRLGCAAAARNQPTRLKHNTFSLKALHPSVPAHIESFAGVTDGAQGVPLQMFCRTLIFFFPKYPVATPAFQLNFSSVAAAPMRPLVYRQVEAPGHSGKWRICEKSPRQAASFF